MKRTPEKVVQAHVVQLLQTVGAVVYVLGTTRRRGDYPGTMQTPGLPDVMAFLPPAPRTPNALVTWKLLCVECKAIGGRLKPAQRQFQQFCALARVSHVVGDLDAVIAWLIAYGYLKG